MKKTDLNNLKEICVKNKIPIVRNRTINFIIKLIKFYNYKSILEIGTGMGYSSNYLISKIDNINVDTIENNLNYYNISIKNTNSRINYILGSVFEFNFVKFYDFIFIDGPKSKQQIIFEKLKNNLNEAGMIVIDNIFLKKVKNTKQGIKLIQKNQIFRNYLENLNDWIVEIIDIDDGIAICQKRENENSSKLLKYKIFQING